MERLTVDEVMALCHRVVSDELSPEELFGMDIPEEDKQNIFHLVLYEIGRLIGKRSPAQRNALRLLRSLLTDKQRRQMSQCHYFYVTGSEGGVYRLWPYHGFTGIVEQVGYVGGQKVFPVRYCFHEEEGTVPPADRIIAQMLLIMADERSFLFQANATARDLRSWRQRRRELRESIMAEREAVA